MSDQYGTYAPPPEVPGQPPQYSPIDQPPVKRSKTGLIIAIIVAVILVLCGCVVVGGLAFFSIAEDSTVSTSTDYPYTGDTALAPDDRMAEWLAWDPAVIEALPSPPSEDGSLVSEAVAILAPGFTVTDTGFSPGWIDEIEEYYYGDMYLVRAVHPSSDQVAAAIEFSLQTPEMIAEDVPFDTEEGDDIDLLAGGTIEMISFGRFGSPDFPIDSAEGEALWRTIGEDWPGAVVMRMTTETETEVIVSLTKWRQYNVEDYSPRVYAVYQIDGGEWELVEWEYESADDLGDDAPVT